MHPSFSLACLVLTVSMSASFVQAQTAAQLAHFEDFDERATEAMADEHWPGAAFAVVRDGQVLFAAGYGLADVRTGTPVSLINREVMGHSGGDPGILTLMYHDPETGNGVIVLINGDIDGFWSELRLARLTSFLLDTPAE